MSRHEKQLLECECSKIRAAFLMCTTGEPLSKYIDKAKQFGIYELMLKERKVMKEWESLK